MVERHEVELTQEEVIEAVRAWIADHSRYTPQQIESVNFKLSERPQDCVLQLDGATAQINHELPMVGGLQNENQN